MTEDQLATIAARATAVAESIRIYGSPIVDADVVAGEDVPALVAEVRRLRAIVAAWGYAVDE
jgi:hypothetical protein